MKTIHSSVLSFVQNFLTNQIADDSLNWCKLVHMHELVNECSTLWWGLHLVSHLFYLKSFDNKSIETNSRSNAKDPKLCYYTTCTVRFVSCSKRFVFYATICWTVCKLVGGSLLFLLLKCSCFLIVRFCKSINCHTCLIFINNYKKSHMNTLN